MLLIQCVLNPRFYPIKIIFRKILSSRVCTLFFLFAATIRRKYESLYSWYRSHDQAINHIHIRQNNFRVSKGAKIRNRYNQVPHLTQDTNGKVTNLQLDTTNESQEVSPFPAGDHKAQINRHAQRHNKYKTSSPESNSYQLET